MFKKITAIFLSALTLCTFGAACKKDDNPQDSSSSTNMGTGIDKTTVLDNIVKDGASDYQILVAEEPTKCEQYAAEEFQNYVEQVSGVTMEIVSEKDVSAFLDDKVVSIGQTALLEECAFKVDYSQLNGDGFIMKTNKNALYINGACDRGTLYGVYDFMEKVCGVKFLDIYTEYVPEMTEIPLYSMDVVERPAFAYRVSLTPMVYEGKEGTITQQLVYSAKERNTSEFLMNSEKYGGNININKNVNQVHNNLTYVYQGKSYNDFKKAHPNCEDMFFYGGTGKEQVRSTPWDICYTNGIADDGTIEDGFNTASAYVEGVKKYIAANPNADYYTFGQEDITTCCECAKCKEVAAQYNGLKSAAVIRFYNAVAREVQAWADEELDGKQINIVIFSYYFSQHAPVVENAKGEFEPMDETVVLADNMIVRFGVITANYSYSFLDEKNAYTGYSPDYLERWKPLMKRCWVWDYTSNHTYYFGWAGTFRKLTKSLQGLAEANCEYAFLQYNNNEYNDWKMVMDNYVASKLLWNPYQDANALREEFITYYYGVVAEDVKAIVKTLDDQYYSELAKDSSIYYQLTEARYFPTEFWMDILDKIEVAENKVKAQTDKSAEELAKEVENIRKLNLTPLFSLLHKRGAHFYDNAEANEYRTKFFNLCSELGVQWYGEHRSIESLKNEFPALSED